MIYQYVHLILAATNDLVAAPPDRWQLLPFSKGNRRAFCVSDLKTWTFYTIDEQVQSYLNLRKYGRRVYATLLFFRQTHTAALDIHRIKQSHTFSLSRKSHFIYLFDRSIDAATSHFDQFAVWGQ